MSWKVSGTEVVEGAWALGVRQVSHNCREVALRHLREPLPRSREAMRLVSASSAPRREVDSAQAIRRRIGSSYAHPALVRHESAPACFLNRDLLKQTSQFLDVRRLRKFWRMRMA